MANRYTNLSTSQFDPMSLQDILAVPLYKQAEFDKLATEQQALKTLPVDPLDVHSQRAMELKNQFETKMDQQALDLAKTGDFTKGRNSFLNLKREYDNLIAPTGEVGRINAAKKVYFDNMKEYLEDATKNKGWSRERALSNWQDKHAKQYTGFDASGKISNIGNYGAPKKIELMDVLKDVKGLLGEQVVREMQNSGYSFATGPYGGAIMIDRKGHRVETSNKPNLIHAQNLINQKLTGQEWQDSIDFEGTSTRDVYNQATSGINSMLNTGVVDNRSQDAQYIAAPKSDIPEVKPDAGVVGEDFNTNTVGGDESSYSDIDRIGGYVNTGTVGSPLTMGSDSSGKGQPKGYFTHNDISNPYEKARYIATYNRLNKTGMFTGTKGADDPRVAQIVKQEMLKQGPITLTSKLLTTDKEIDALGFSAVKGKTAKDRDAQMRRELQLTNAGARKLIGPDGKEYTFAEAKDKFDLKGINSVTYQGYLSPLNWEKDNFKGTNSKASPHIITIEDKDGNFQTFKTSRTNSDNANINIKRFNDLQNNYRKSTVNPNEWNQFQSESPSLSKLQIKYNTRDPQVDPVRGVLNYEIKDKDGNVHYMNDREYIYSVNNTK